MTATSHFVGIQGSRDPRRAAGARGLVAFSGG
jgi:hypothetical protein